MNVKYIPNIITGVRIVSTLFLLPLTVFTAPFYVLHTLCGASDLADGAVARLTHTQSDFGAKLDSIADLLFWAVMIAKVFPFILPRLGTYGVSLLAIVLALRAVNYVVCFVRHRTFPSLHTWLNKLTGFALFVSIYLLKLLPMHLICTVLGIIAIAAVAEELFIHLMSGGSQSNTHSLKDALERMK